MIALDLQQFNQAVTSEQEGQKAEAFAILDKLSQLCPNEPNLLLWLAFTTDNFTVASRAVQKVAVLDPTNVSLPAARKWLQQLEATSNQNNHKTERYSPPISKPTASANIYDTTTALAPSTIYTASNGNSSDGDLYQLRSDSTRTIRTPHTVAATSTWANLDAEWRNAPKNNNRLIIAVLSVGIALIAIAFVVVLISGSNANQNSNPSITFLPSDKSFSILMPATPALKPQTFSNGITGTQCYVGLNNDLVEYAVTYGTAPRTLQPNQVNALFNFLTNALVNQGYTLTTQKTFSINQSPALYMEAEGKGEHLRIEFLISRANEMFEIDLLSKDGQNLPIDPQTYFGSFKIL